MSPRICKCPSETQVGGHWCPPEILTYAQHCKCVLLKDHNAVASVRLEPAAPRSRVKHSTTDPLRSRNTTRHTLQTNSFINAEVVRLSVSWFFRCLYDDQQINVTLLRNCLQVPEIDRHDPLRYH